jgi:16S rRNA (cytidine1402-2'-O)-methyltransferase
MRELNFIGNSPILYIVATPIGNLDEMTPRAIEILSQVDFVACEDTRVSGKLLSHFNIHKTLITCFEHNENEASSKVIELLNSGKKVAYMSDAGYPCISDPGSRLIKLALESGIKVSPISGPNAMLNALVGSGLDTSKFYFHGFLDSKESIRNNELHDLYKKSETMIFYEAPHRIDKTLKAMFNVLGNRKACIARELTKLHEEFIRGNLEELSVLDVETLKGEMVIVVEGNKEELSINPSDDEIISMVNNLTDMGISTKDAIKKASELLKIPKNYIYELYHHN